MKYSRRIYLWTQTKKEPLYSRCEADPVSNWRPKHKNSTGTQTPRSTPCQQSNTLEQTHTHHKGDIPETIRQNHTSNGQQISVGVAQRAGFGGHHIKGRNRDGDSTGASSLQHRALHHPSGTQYKAALSLEGDEELWY